MIRLRLPRRNWTGRNTLTTRLGSNGRNRIEASGMKRRALQQPPDCQASSLERSMPPNRPHRVMRTSGMKPASATRAKYNRQHGRKRQLIQPHQTQQNPRRQSGQNWQNGG